MGCAYTRVEVGRLAAKVGGGDAKEGEGKN